ncbi:MAG: TIGR04283 family arsenosugar biosynthesis glycosyltransferase [Chitinophagaceae bacterium]|nr:TIGR04283 family arsenosugar biosynthesis glycosyltransferase [Chitinophagaceae bacterium]
MNISVIIPVFIEASVIESTIGWLLKDCIHKQVIEIIVVDGGSTDGSAALAANSGALIVHSGKGRAAQMNAGAAIARGQLLYFLHADTKPPNNYVVFINTALKYGYDMGCFRLQFDRDHWFLRANTWFTRFNVNYFRFGDQSLFVKKELFKKTGGFNESLIVLEDQEMIRRLRMYGKFNVMPAAVITSARKYTTNGIYKTQAVYFLIYLLFRLGVSQQRLVSLYKKLIRQDKL